MDAQPASQQNTAAEIAPPIQARMPWRVARLIVLEGFKLHVVFVDGLEGKADMSALIHSLDAGVFAALADASIFAQARIEHGAVTWPGDIDIAPDAMHRAIKAGGCWTA